MPSDNHEPLPPIDFTEDVQRFEAFSEQKEVVFQTCPHKDIEYVDGAIRCRCGVGWSGSRLDELYRALKK